MHMTFHKKSTTLLLWIRNDRQAKKNSIKTAKNKSLKYFKYVYYNFKQLFNHTHLQHEKRNYGESGNDIGRKQNHF